MTSWVFMSSSCRQRGERVRVFVPCLLVGYGVDELRVAVATELAPHRDGSRDAEEDDVNADGDGGLAGHLVRLELVHKTDVDVESDGDDAHHRDLAMGAEVSRQRRLLVLGRSGLL